MLLELQSGKKAVGRKQSQRAIQDGKARKLFLAEDADASIRQEMQELCQTRGVEVALVPTMAELGPPPCWRNSIPAINGRGTPRPSL